jgi:3-hydroxyisobutyrate dehydrogenase-like beta-hydroxyacid dehydrogenase
LARAGHDGTVHNRSARKAEAWAEEYGGRMAATPEAAARGAAAVFLAVGDDDDVRAVTCGPDGAFQGMARGSVLVDHTTTSAALARELAEEAERRGLFFLDAPLAGGQKGANAGKLSIMIGGDAGAAQRVKPLLHHYAAGIEHMGPPGSGQLTKMVNQICATGIIQSLAEGINFAQKAGLDDRKVVEVISKGSAASWQIGNRAQPMQRRDFSAGGSVSLLFKDLDICLEEARRLGVKLPLLELVQRFYGEIVAEGRGGLDAASLVERLDRAASD